MKYLIGILITVIVMGCTKSDSSSDTQETKKVTATAPKGHPVRGAVTFEGETTKGSRIRMSADPYCKSAWSKPATEDKLLVSEQGGLQNVYVRITKGVSGPVGDGASLPPVTLDQSKCMYAPRVIAVQTGQTIKILNSDSTLHNVNASPKTNRGFNVGMATKGQEIKKTFKKPEVMVPLKCDVHGWMAAYIGVTNHPYFAVSGEDGAFVIENVPPGEYTVEAWHETLGTKTASLTVKDDGSASELKFAFGS